MYKHNSPFYAMDVVISAIGHVDVRTHDGLNSPLSHYDDGVAVKGKVAKIS